MAEKVTMVLEVDLQCPCCYKKVKKLLCKFPQIRDQVYDEKKNTVTITVICCSPEKIRDKLCCKGGKVIKSIEIIKPPPPKPKPPPEKPPAEKPKPPEKPPADKPKPPEKPPADKPKPPEKPPAEKPKPAPVPVPLPAPQPAPKAPEPAPPKAPKPAPKAPEPAPQPIPTMPVPGYGCPSIFPFPFEACCGPCSEGQGGGPCYHGYGRPQPCYDNCGYGPYCRGRPYYVSRCDEYLNDENTSACTIM